MPDPTHAHQALLATIAAHLPVCDPADTPWATPLRAERLHWLCHTANTTPMALDKLARWAGYAQGVATARAWPMPPLPGPIEPLSHAPIPDCHPALVDAHRAVLAYARTLLPATDTAGTWPQEARALSCHTLITTLLDAYFPLTTLARATGYVQGIACTRGWMDADAERERTRPIFHAAAKAAGHGRPQTLGPERA